MEEGLNLRQKRILLTINKTNEGRLSRNKIRDKIIDENKDNPDSKMSHQTFQNELNKLVDRGYLQKFEKLQGKKKYVIYSLPSIQIHDERQISKFINSFDTVRENIQILKDKSWKHSVIKTQDSLDNSLPNYQHLHDMVREIYPESDFKSITFVVDHPKFPNRQFIQHHFGPRELVPISPEDMEILECNNEKRLAYHVISRLISFMMILQGLFNRMSERNRYSKEFIKLEPFFDEIQNEIEALTSKYNLDSTSIEEYLLQSTTKTTGLLLRDATQSFKNFNIFLPHDATAMEEEFGIGTYTNITTWLSKSSNWK